jgi:hypothetical protein
MGQRVIAEEVASLLEFNCISKSRNTVKNKALVITACGIQHTYLPSYLGVGTRRIMDQDEPRQKSLSEK